MKAWSNSVNAIVQQIELFPLICPRSETHNFWSALHTTRKCVGQDTLRVSYHHFNEPKPDWKPKWIPAPPTYFIIDYLAIKRLWVVFRFVCVGSGFQTASDQISTQPSWLYSKRLFGENLFVIFMHCTFQRIWLSFATRKLSLKSWCVCIFFNVLMKHLSYGIKRFKIKLLFLLICIEHHFFLRSIYILT